MAQVRGSGIEPPLRLCRCPFYSHRGGRSGLALAYSWTLSTCGRGHRPRPEAELTDDVLVVVATRVNWGAAGAPARRVVVVPLFPRHGVDGGAVCPCAAWATAG